MSIRGLYIIQASPNADVPVFTKLFPTVEMRYKSLSGQSYVNIPREREFIELLFTEIRLKSADEEHDQCDKEHLNPAFQVKTACGNLWPVIVMKHRRYIYAAISFEENLYLNKQSNAKFMIMSSVASILEALNGLARYVEKYNLLQSPSGKVELLKYFRSALPYGRPVCCDPSVAQNFPAAFWKGKVKQPAWNPVLHKGKSYVTIYIREEVRSIQFNTSEATDQLEVEGVISCASELEGAAPEISLVLSNTTDCNILVNTCVSNIETITSSTKLRFHPVKSQTICLYKVCAVHQPPLCGSFSMKVDEGVAKVSVNLRMQPMVKNAFQKLDVHIPFSNDISSVKSQCSQGTLSVQSTNTLVWNVGSKLPSKTLSASLETRIKLKHKKTNSDFCKQDDSIIAQDHYLFPEAFTCIKYATVIFTIVDYVYSGTKIDPTSILVTSSSKVNRSVASECSGEFKIKNSEYCESAEGDSLVDDLSALLHSA